MQKAQLQFSTTGVVARRRDSEDAEMCGVFLWRKEHAKGKVSGKLTVTEALFA